MKKRFLVFKQVNKYCLYLAVFLTPLFFFPFSQNVLDYPKQILLLTLTLLSLIGWLAGQLIQGEIQIKINKIFYISLALVLFSSALACAFSIWRYGSLFGWSLNVSESFLSTFIFTLLAFLIYNTIHTKKEIISLIFLLISSSVLAGIFATLQLYNIFLLPFNFSKSPSFNFLGTPNTAALFLASLLPLIFCLYFCESISKKLLIGISSITLFLIIAFINFKTAWILLFFGSLFFLFLVLLKGFPEIKSVQVGIGAFCLILSLFFVFFRVPIPKFPIVPPEVTLTFNSEYDILKGAFSQNIKNIILGTGPGTFIFNYSKYRSPVLNKSIFWGTRFPQGYSTFFDLMVTHGLFGVITLLFLWLLVLIFGMKKFIKGLPDKDLQILLLGGLCSFSMSVLAQFLYPINFSLHFLTFMLIGLLMITIDSQLKKKETQIKTSGLKLVFSTVFIVVFVLSIVIIFVVQRNYLAQVLYFKGIQDSKNGDVKQAINKIEKACQLNPFMDMYWRDLAQLYLTYANLISLDKNLTLQQKQNLVQVAISKGIKALNKATKINPQNVANWNVRGFFYRNLIGIQTAGELSLESYKKATQLEPASPFAFGELGRVYILMAQDFAKKGDDKGRSDSLRYAKKNLEKALALKPDYAPAHYLLAVVYDQQGKLDEAIAKLEETKRFAPKDAGLAFQLGVLYWRKRNLENARKEFERAIEINPNYSNARYMLGLVYDRLGEIEKAKEQFQIVLKLNPENKEVKEILENLEKGKPALEGVSATAPPIQKTPEEIQK
jgi:Tfp pilus assembly protein PilF